MKGMALPPMPTISEIVKLYGLSARQQLSQNFILDLNVCHRIVRSCGPLTGRTVLEVGAGPGNLTRSVLMAGARHVVAIEKDGRFLPALELLRQAAGPERMSIVHGDALLLDEGELLRAAEAEAVPWSSAEDAQVHVVGNLPFSVSTELLLKWVHQMPGRRGPFEFGRVPMTLLFQKEVAYRLFASVGSKEYSRLSVMTQHCARVKHCFDISGSAFVPRPDVDTGVVTVTPLAEPLVEVRLATMEYVLRQVFGQRRKMLRNAVSTLQLDEALSEGNEAFAAEVLKASGLDETKRPEQLSVQDWAALSNTYDRLMAEAMRITPEPAPVAEAKQ